MTRLQLFIYKQGLGRNRKCRLVRYLYWRLSGHRYLWGIRHFLDDHYQADPRPCTTIEIKEVYDWIEKYSNEIFQKIK